MRRGRHELSLSTLALTSGSIEPFRKQISVGTAISSMPAASTPSKNSYLLDMEK